MKLVNTIILVFFLASPVNDLFSWFHSLTVTTYYVSNAGSDGNAGTSTGSPFLTITHAKSVSVPGDIVLLNRGDVFNESITITTSGTSGNVITFGAYGTGANPQINAFENENSGWTNEGGNIWSKVIPNAVTNLNTVYINGSLREKGRTPNSGFLTYLPASSHRNTTVAYIKTTTLNGSEGYAGAELVHRNSAYIYDANIILSQHNDTIFGGNCVTNPYSSGLVQFGFTYSPDSLGTSARNQYFIQNFLAALDTANEWYWKPSENKLYIYSTGSPTDVKVSTRDTLIYANHKNYITFDGIDIIGANKMGFGLDTCSHIVHQNSTYKYIGAKAIDGRGSTNISALTDSFLNIWSNGIWAERGSKFLTVTNSYFKNIGTRAGMGLSNNSTYMAIWSAGDTCNISYNRGDSIGFNVAYIQGKRDTVYRNWFTNYCFVKDDGGGIVTYGIDYSGTLIRGNIVQHGISTGGDAAAGIYIDANSTNLTVDSNTIEDTKTYGAIINTSTNGIVFRDNTIVDSAAFGLYLSSAYTLDAKHNIIYAKLSAQGRGCVIAFGGGANRVLDSNYYLCPSNEATKLKFGGNIPKTLAEWRLLTTPAWDVSTTETPSGITAAAGVLRYNATNADVTVYLNGLYIDGKGGEHNNYIILHAFQSALLFKADHELPVPSRILRSTFKLIQS